MKRLMIKAAGVLALTALLAACGADGAPTPPSAKPGISIRGEAQVGVVAPL